MREEDLFSLTEHPEVRFIVAPKDKYFKYDAGDTRKDCLIPYNLWESYLLGEITALQKSKGYWHLLIVDGADILCSVLLHDGKIKYCGDMTDIILEKIPQIKLEEDPE